MSRLILRKYSWRIYFPVDFHHISLKLFRISQLLPIDALPAHYPRGPATVWRAFWSSSFPHQAHTVLCIYKCFQDYVLMVKQSLLVRSGLSGGVIGVLYLMVVPSGPMKLLHEQRKQSSEYMMRISIESV
ncbi:uncharacterized protein RHIMIDRAFT_24752 [Rhizopus microsporus ATCC 52813]|uniref:Uncharacterized protein n=1 Tax=Rhizopus microsporus ATCC 52813 TaxID=1340429 RepID=A0A2G4SRV0_RHIZD|nr:uncharacterized protein RHIMIDRAFT_24752 [Rhizopus microsporus ATCC 52813]PHZ11472.1 hypothetical protein RHIMIDRAFT_24752 [Rhizopus microsporus ATCC 52813]